MTDGRPRRRISRSRRCARARDAVALPGSKSISNRTLLLAALAHGTTRSSAIARCRRRRRACSTRSSRSASPSNRDARTRDLRRARRRTARSGQALGEALSRQRRHGVSAADRGAGDARAATTVLTGVPRMHERPIGDLVDALRVQGCEIALRAVQRRISAARDRPRRRHAPAATVSIRGDVSSQFTVGAADGAAARARRGPRRHDGSGHRRALISRPVRRDHDQPDATLRRRGRHARCRDLRVPAGARYRAPGALAVEGDASSASYFLAAGVLGGGPVRVDRRGSRRRSRATSRSPTCSRAHGRRRSLRRRLDRGAPAGSSPAARSTATRFPTPR